MLKTEMIQTARNPNSEFLSYDCYLTMTRFAPHFFSVEFKKVSCFRDECQRRPLAVVPEENCSLQECQRYKLPHEVYLR